MINLFAKIMQGERKAKYKTLFFIVIIWRKCFFESIDIIFCFFVW